MSITGDIVGGAEPTTLVIEQNAHGFLVGQALYNTGTDYALAKADVVATSNALGIVISVVNVNTFVLAFAGFEGIFSGLVPGSTYYLSDTVAGGVTITEPTLSRPMYNAVNATEAFIFTDERFDKGNLVLSVNPGLNTNITGGATTPIINVDNPFVGDVTGDVNGIGLIGGGGGTNYLDDSGGYSVPPGAGVQSVGAGQNLNNTGDATNVVLNLDSAITSTSVNGVTLNAAAAANTFLNNTGGYSVPPDTDINLGNADFSVPATPRKVDFPTSGSFSVSAFDGTTINNSLEAGSIVVSKSFMQMAYQVLDGAGGLVSLRTISVTPNDFVFEDTTDMKAARYGTTGYAVTLDNQIPHKEYVDSAIAAFGASSFSIDVSSQQDLIDAGIPINGSDEFEVSINLHFLESVSDWSVGRGIKLLTGATITSASSHQNIIVTGDRDTTPFINVGGVCTVSGVAFDNVGTGDVLEVDAPNFSFDFSGARCIGKMRLVNCGRVVFSNTSAINNGGTISIGGGLVGGLVFGDVAIVGVANGTKMVEIESTAVVTKLTLGTGTFITTGFIPTITGSSCIYVQKGAQIETANLMDFGLLAPEIGVGGNAGLVMQDPSDVGVGNFMGVAAQMGLSDVFGMEPVETSNFTPAGVGLDVRGCGTDGSNNLIVVDTDVGQAEFILYNGITDSENSRINAPGNNPQDVGWWRGNLISSDASTDICYLHDGFSTTITAQTPGLGTLAIPIIAPGGFATDGTFFYVGNLNTDQIHVFGSDFFTATLPVQIAVLNIPGLADPTGLSWNGTHMMVADETNAICLILQGATEEVLYTFTFANITNLHGATFTNDGFVTSHSNEVVRIFDSSPVLNYSSDTWQMADNIDGNLIESSDHGGSVFDSPTPITITPASAGAWTDISGVGIAYGSSQQREKCHVSNENTGEIEWDGVREKGRLITANITAEAGAGTANFDIVITINGVPQLDSLGSHFYTSPGEADNLDSANLTYKLNKGDLIGMQFRNPGGTISLDVLSARLSIN